MTSIKFKLAGEIVIEDEREPAAIITIRYQGFTVTMEGKDMAYTLPSGMKVDIKVAYIDLAGNPAVVDGDVEWSTSDPSLASVTATGPDSAVIHTMGPVGQCQIIATADADLGEGVRELITPMDLTIAAGEAISGTISPTGPAQPI